MATATATKENLLQGPAAAASAYAATPVEGTPAEGSKPRFNRPGATLKEDATRSDLAFSHGFPLKEHLTILAAFKQLRDCVRNNGADVLHRPIRRGDRPFYDAEDAPPPAYSAAAPEAPPTPTQMSTSTSAPPPPSSSATNGNHEASVSASASASAPASTADDARWNEFLLRALARFRSWTTLVASQTEWLYDAQVDSLRPTMARLGLVPYVEEQAYRPFAHAQALPLKLMPPLDVLIIWHSFLLNPSRYIEDAIRGTHLLERLAIFRFPTRKVAAALRHTADGFEYNAPRAACDLFESQMHMDYNPIECAQRFQVTAVPCPLLNCEQMTQIPFNELILPDWSRKCERCSQVITANTLRGAQFLRDAERWCDALGSDRSAWRMRGAVFSERNALPFFKDPFHPLLDRAFHNKRHRTGMNSTSSGDQLTSANNDALGRIKSKDGPRKGAPRDLLQQTLQSHDITQLATALVERVTEIATSGFVKLKKTRIQYEISLRVDCLVRHYIDSNPLASYSLDLPAAVRRQESFIDDMDHLGWLSAVDESQLVNSLARYEAWMRLISFHPGEFLSPTLDVDLAWHTHQLQCTYYVDCFYLVGRFLDHDDKVGKGDLRDAFQRTSDIWTREYRQPYSLCGCCNQYESPMRKTVSSIKAKLKGKEKSRSDNDAAVLDRDGPDHPSAHNAITIIGVDDGGENGKGSSTEQHVDAFDDPKRCHPAMTPFYYMPPADMRHEPGQGIHARDENGAAPCVPGNVFRRIPNSIDVAAGVVSPTVPVFANSASYGGYGAGGCGGGGCGGGGCGGGGC